MPIKLSYINARGDEAILDDDEGTFAHELRGREGFEFPSLKITEHDYGDGSTDIAAITLKNRSVTCYFWADVMDIPHWEEKFNEVKSVLLQTGQKDGEWGKLKIRTREGHYVYLNCVYEKGLDTLIRDIDMRVKFSLTFTATSPYFYNGFEQSLTIRQDDRAGYIFMNDCQICTTEAEAKTVSGWKSGQDKGKYYWKIGGTSQYYAIKASNTLFMADANTVDSATEARTISGDTSKIGDATRKAKMVYWGVPNDSSPQYYYAISEQNSLYMRSADGNTTDDLFITCERVYPTIIINGPASFIRLENGTTGRVIQIDNSVILDTNDKIEIVTQPLKRRIRMKRKGSSSWTNLIPKLSIDSTLDWPLEHGTNAISFNNMTVTPETYLQFKYTERMSGIQ